ncbi:MAG: hypothetical protein IT330_12415 [Anaerolineae bacterium]|nr:hypothetical protein [Anaerolineae bacterium]
METLNLAAAEVKSEPDDSIGLAARQLVRELGVMPLAPQWRALGKPHAEWERSDG